ncbi:MBL fold metallo-hydrolase [Thauera sinica]|uniref:MBL fold metallo-hydrolase n=1 Tax=Thauera sinica TaxID=2665146 RepID=A0ABW1AM22_9RHOO|nr:MBL fold metallo-hydrolase [Thauera sp. K11]
MLVACLTAGPALAAETAAPVVTPAGNGIYTIIGSTNEASPENRGRVGNAGFIVGPDGTVVINTGSSYRHGRELLEAAERIGGKPVVLAVITQPLQEFIMGSAAFAERGIPLLAHEAAARLIGERCEQCLRNLTRLLGAQAMRGTRVVVPARTVSQSGDIEAGGRRLRLLHFGWGSTPGDLAVLDPASGTLFAGALVSVGRIPDLRDADVRGWLDALDALGKLSPRTLVPGYGPVADAGALVPVRHYIERLAEEVLARQRGGASLYEAIRDTRLPGFADWALHAVLHPRNVHRLYLQFENEELNP